LFTMAGKGRNFRVVKRKPVELGILVTRVKPVKLKVVEKNGVYFVLGTIRLITDNGYGNYYKILYTPDNEEDMRYIMDNPDKKMIALFNLGMDKFNRINKLGIHIKKIIPVE